MQVHDERALSERNSKNDLLSNFSLHVWQGGMQGATQCRQCTDQTGNGDSSVFSHWTWQQTTAECMKGTMRLTTGSKSCESLVVASRRFRESIVKVSTQTAVVSERGQRRTKVFEVHGQHQHQQDPSFENRDRATLVTVEQTWSGMKAMRVSGTSSSAQAPAWSLGAEAVQRCDGVECLERLAQVTRRMVRPRSRRSPGSIRVTGIPV